MNIKLLIFGLIHQLSLVNFVYSACSKIVTRKEIRQLSSDELDRFLTATKRLHEEKMDIYDWFVKIHNEVGDNAHNVPAFLPWHRVFLRKYEAELQKIDSRVVLPYWDWSIDSQRAEESDVLSNKMMGGNGQGKEWCVVDGVAANWWIRTSESRCLTRQYANGNRVGELTSKDGMESVIQSNTNYPDFVNGLGNPHAQVHVNLGNYQAEMSLATSPNDPVFWLHHCFLDKMWFEWQMRDNKRLNQYGGYDNYRKKNATMNDDLWKMNTQVRKVMDTKSDGYCYQYERYGSPNTQKSLEESPVMANQMSAKSDETIWDKIKNIPMSAISTKYFLKDSQASGNHTRLSFPDRISESYIKKFNLNQEEIEKNYEFLTKIILILNANPNFKPDTSL